MLLYFLIATLVIYPIRTRRDLNLQFRCSLVRRALSHSTSQNPWILFPNTVNHSTSESICAQSDPLFHNCCTIHQKGVKESKNVSELHALRTRWLHPVLTTFMNHSFVLHEFFVESLNLTMSALDVSFRSSYGYNYQQNKDFFLHFFTNLRNYMLGKRQNISALVDDFFHGLLIRIVRLLLFAKSKNEILTADCISLELEKNKPFDRIPESIKKMAIRSFPPARIVANALLIASETMSVILREMVLSDSCHIDWLKLRYCSYCYGEVNAVICPDSCRRKMALCLIDYTALNVPWTQFIDHLLALIERLSASDSFPQVNRPLQIHITDAIMNFQRVFSQIDPSLLNKCNYQGMHPVASSVRQKRQLLYPPEPNVFPSIPETVDYFHAVPSLENQTKMMHTRYLSMRSLFANLDVLFCTPELLRSSQRSAHLIRGCWDGEHVSFVHSSKVSSPYYATSNPWVTRVIARLQNVTRMLQSVLVTNADPDFLQPQDPVFLDQIRSITVTESRNNVLKLSNSFHASSDVSSQHLNSVLSRDDASILRYNAVSGEERENSKAEISEDYLSFHVTSRSHDSSKGLTEPPSNHEMHRTYLDPPNQLWIPQLNQKYSNQHQFPETRDRSFTNQCATLCLTRGRFASYFAVLITTAHVRDSTGV